MTYQTAFKRLKEKFENVETSKLSNMAIQFTLSDEDCGGTFYAEAKDGKLYVEPYDYKDNDAVVDVTRAALTKILDGKLTIDKAIDDGELTVKGNLEKIKNVADAIKVPEPKTETKKECGCAAEDKPEVKAETKPAKKCRCEAKAEVKAEVKAETKAEVKAETKPAKRRGCAAKKTTGTAKTSAASAKSTAAKKPTKKNKNTETKSGLIV